jgi:hypothetical protein
MENKKSILKILEAIQSFQIVQCQMHHEKVLTNSEANPIYNLLDGKLVFHRVNLCDRSLRNKRLGCAHSGVNLNFKRIL